MVQSNQIEGQTESNCVSFVSFKSVSWPILHGSLDDTVSCESSLCPVNFDASPKPAVVLRRPSDDCGPCEIKISFEQKHEIRQVYVRSTARVYEIYYAADRRSINEYLCTVRCGKVEIDEECLAEEDLSNNDAVTSISPSSNGPVKLLKDGVLKSENGGSTNEDGWVEIKDPDPSLTDDGESSRPSKIEVCIERENHQDLYEATAEISDANPCTSITIRLLSLQNRDSVYLDEVYVFADPVECDNDNSTTEEVERSSGNSIMSMLVPTLLQLSKSRMSQVCERRDPSLDIEKAVQDKSQSMSLASSTSKIQQEEIHLVRNEREREMASDKPTRPDQLTSLEVPKQPSNNHDKSGSSSEMDVSYDIGKTLDQLVSRIARIEEFCLGFEERMINPITSMDARLGNVEQQLKLLNERFQISEMHSSTGIHAPDLYSSNMESNMSYTDGNTILNYKAKPQDDCLSYEVQAPSSDTPPARGASLVPIIVTAPEFSISSEHLDNGNCLSDEAATLASGIPSIATARTHLVPSLVVTAPEFSYGDEEEENDVSKSVGGSPRDESKKPQSIDDALAFALAGFLSSSSVKDSTSVLHPDTSMTSYDSDKAGSNILPSEPLECDKIIVCADLVGATIETLEKPVAENEKRDVLFGSNSETAIDIFAGLDNGGEESGHTFLGHDLFGSNSETAVDIFAGLDNGGEESGHPFLGHDLDEPVADIGEHAVLFFGGNSESTVEIMAKHDYVLADENAHTFVFHDADDRIAEAGKTIVEAQTLIMEEFEFGDAEKDGSNILSEVANKVDPSGEMVIIEASDVLHNILDLPIKSVVDYKTPVLDVKFASRESSNISTSIEALLSETAETDVRSSSVQERNWGNMADQPDQDYSMQLDSIEAKSVEASEHLLVDFGLDDLSYLSQNSEAISHDSYESCNYDVPVALL